MAQVRDQRPSTPRKLFLVAKPSLSNLEFSVGSMQGTKFLSFTDNVSYKVNTGTKLDNVMGIEYTYTCQHQYQDQFSNNPVAISLCACVTV